jgi:hypothetical protein
MMLDVLFAFVGVELTLWLHCDEYRSLFGRGCVTVMQCVIGVP